MSALTVDGELVHYEKLGRGRPVILIHGWIGSWRYWIPLMKVLSLKYSVYALDLFGFGDSSKNVAHYELEHQIRLLTEFTQKMGIPKAAFVGHGLGAMVITQFARKYPDKVARMLITSAPLFDPGDLDKRTPAGTRTRLEPPKPILTAMGDVVPDATDKVTDEASPDGDKTETAETGTPFHELPTVPRLNPSDIERLKLAAANRVIESPLPADTPAKSDETESDKTVDASLADGANHLARLFNTINLEAMLQKAFKRGDEIYEKLKADVDKTDNDILLRTAKGYDAGRMLDDLRSLPMPIVIVHGEDDPIIVAPNEKIWNYLTQDKEDTILPIPLPGVRHFPMLEHEPFSRLVTDFLETADISKLEVKERWRRRSR